MTGTEIAQAVSAHAAHRDYDLRAVTPLPARRGYLPRALVVVHLEDNPYTPFVLWTASIDEDGACSFMSGTYFVREHDAKEALMTKYMRGAA